MNSMNGFTRAQAQALEIMPMFTGTLSIIGSLTVIIIILRSHIRLSTTYHRILFGLSCSDILQSITLALSSLPVPTGTPDILLAIGNEVTCNIQGFFFMFGIISLTFYFCGLSGYFLLAIKFNVPEETISKLYEPFVHIISIGYGLLGAILTATMNGFFTSGNKCWMAPKPMNCDKFDTVECISGEHYAIFRWVFIAGPVIFSFITISTNMLIIFWTLIRQNSESHITMGTNNANNNVNNANNNTNNNTNNTTANENTAHHNSIDTNNMNNSDRHNYTSLEQELDELENGQEPTPQATTTTTTFAENTQPNNNTTTTTASNKPTVLELYAAQKKKKKSKSQKDRKEAMVQALLYIFVFLVSYIFSAVYNSMDQSGKTPSYYLLLTSQIFYPLQGFLIFFIYLRPNIVSIKRRNPTHSFFQILKAAITSRGEDPRKTKRRRTFKKLSQRASMTNATSAGTAGGLGGGLGGSARNRNSSTGNGGRRYSLNVCTGADEVKEEKERTVQFRKRTSETDLEQSNESERSSQKRVRLAPNVMEELNQLYQEGEKRDMEKEQEQQQQQQQQQQLEQKEEEEKKQEGIEDGMDLEDEEERNLKKGLLKLSSELEE